jgi:hypothetical protein
MDFVLDDSCIAAMDAIHIFSMYPLEQSNLGAFLDFL